MEKPKILWMILVLLALSVAWNIYMLSKINKGCNRVDSAGIRAELETALAKFDIEYDQKLDELSRLLNIESTELRDMDEQFIKKIRVKHEGLIKGFEECPPSNDLNVQNDLTAGIIDEYKNFAGDFDTVVNDMIKDAQGKPSNVPEGRSGAIADSSIVNTAQLTTDGLIVQAKQSLRDTIGEASSAVFETLKKLSQQLGQ